MKQQFPPQLKVDLQDAVDVECEMCQNTHFVPAFIIKKIPAFVSPTGQETMVPIQVFKCDKCNHINKPFLNGLTN